MVEAHASSVPAKAVGRSGGRARREQLCERKRRTPRRRESRQPQLTGNLAGWHHIVIGSDKVQEDGNHIGLGGKDLRGGGRRIFSETFDLAVGGSHIVGGGSHIASGGRPIQSGCFVIT